MRSIRSWGLVLVLLPACTRPNPLFVGDEDGEDGEDEVTNGEVTTSGEVTGGEVGDTTLTSSADASAEGLVTTDASATTEVAVDTGELDTGFMCELELRDPFGIVAEPSLETIFEGCPEVETLTISVTESTGNVIEGSACDNGCITCSTLLTLTFDVPLPPLPPLPECVEITFQLDPDSCELQAYKLEPIVGPPIAVVSNVIAPMFETPISLALEHVVDECDQGCDQPSGQYSLISPNGTSIPPDGAPVTVDGLPPYDVVNDGSGIDAACEEVGRWHAVLSPLGL